MKDFFKEQLVKKEYTKKDRNQRGFRIGICVAVCVFLWQIIGTAANRNEQLAGAFFLLAVILVGVITFFGIKWIKALRLEFEYCYTDGIFDIDVIKNKSKRKQIFSGYVEEFELMAPSDDDRLKMYSSLPTEDCSSQDGKNNKYAFIASYKGKKKKYTVEPCDEILRAMHQDMGSRFIKKR
ncbi:MAG TPA: hypothetical protein DCG28_05585 [Lachnospiraceae bacterium]|nr:hypothetical protein [Lachnospiraceae bacterium]